MIEQFKALFVVFTLAAGAFAFASIAYREHLTPARIARWRNLFLAASVASFLVPNYWAVIFLVAVIALALGVGEKNRPAIYLVLLFAFPAVTETVPGFAGIRNFLDIGPFHILAIVILFPLLLRRQETASFRRYGSLADYCFIAFSTLSLVLAFRGTNFTDGIRQATTYALTAFGPYLVFSRYYWTKERLTEASLAYVIPMIALAGVALAETVLGWHFYANAVANWDISFFFRYLARSGYLRAYASVFGPISFGLFLLIAVSLALAILVISKRKPLPAIGLLAVGVGLIVTFSRGPWIGAAFASFVVAATSAQPVQNILRLGGAGLAVFVVAALTPIGPELINMLPFIGTIEGNTIDYRERLFEVGIGVAMRNPIFGSENYLQTPAMQSLIQGQGIIDLVNTYLRVVLETGFVGLALFVGVSGFAALSALRAIGTARRLDPAYAALVQAWFAALLGVMLTLATTTNVVAQIAEVHWMLCGICVGLARSVRMAVAESAKAPPAEPSNAPPLAPPPAPGPSQTMTLPADRLPPHLRQYANREK